MRHAQWNNRKPYKDAQVFLPWKTPKGENQQTDCLYYDSTEF